jgi:hypothetical protein
MAQRARRARRPFQRSVNSLEWVTAELLRRELRTVQDCETLWTHSGNPIALVGALALVDGPAPPWLTDALLATLVPGEDGWKSPLPRLIARRWAEVQRDAVNAYRVLRFSEIRAGALKHRRDIVVTREQSAMMAAVKFRGTAAAIGARRSRTGTREPTERLVNEGSRPRAALITGRTRAPSGPVALLGAAPGISSSLDGGTKGVL